MSESRDGVNATELEPFLRERLVALDEPVGRASWPDIVSRSRRLRPRAPLTALVVALLALGVALPIAGLQLFRDSHQARTNFVHFKVGAPPIAADAIPSQTRMITSAHLQDGRHTLYVSPDRNGGFCYLWTGSAGGCDELTAAPFTVARANRQVVGAVSFPRISSVEIKFTDGTAAQPDLSWISAPINAGFFLYDVPAGKTVAEIDMR
jgi:hypothetical protein